jgi:hypothetical protein
MSVVAKYLAIASAEGEKILTSLTPLNEGYDIEDVRIAEKRLAILPVEGISVDDRKAVILRKMRHPGTQVDRAHYLWLQKLIQESGFPTAFVHENRFGGGPYAPVDPQPFLDADGKICASYLDQDDDDSQFIVTADPQRWANFVFIGGSAFGEYINIPQSRYEAFRLTVLSIKQNHIAAVLLVKLLPY